MCHTYPGKLECNNISKVRVGRPGGGVVGSNFALNSATKMFNILVREHLVVI